MLDERLKERELEERAQAAALIALGIPVAAVCWLFLSWALALLVWWAGELRLSTSFAICGAIVAAILAVDVWRHPSEHWRRARYFVDGDASWVASDGLFAGMPLMASVTDPGNLAERGRELTSGAANVILSGPRNIRAGVELLRLSKARRSAMPAARDFVAWLAERGPSAERDVEEALEREPGWTLGFALARELGAVAIRRGPEGRQVVAK